MKRDQPLPPGTILQFMYLKERLRLLKPGRFIEVGCGQGLLTRILLQAGWAGTAYDLNESSLEKARHYNSDFLANSRLSLKNKDWLNEPANSKVDLVISSLVLEHLDDASEALYIDKCKASLVPDGKVILFVPNSPAHWGIEDEIAGHYRRYTQESLRSRFNGEDWNCLHLAGLTYPISNWLLPLGDRLVRQSEENKLEQTMIYRTVQSGNRNVAFKTSFPLALNLFLNEATLFPFYLLQKANIARHDALILYGEFGASQRVEKAQTTGLIARRI